MYSLEALNTFQPMARCRTMNTKGCLTIMLEAGSNNMIELRFSKNQQQTDDDSQKGSMTDYDENDPLAIMW
jgi:hypothetical protein